MRQLGLKLSDRLKKPSVVTTGMLVFVTVSCTRAANQDSVPPSKSDGGGASVAPSALAADSGTSGARAAALDAKTFDDSTRTIEAKVGDRFTINLPANITTPYKWVVASPETLVVLTDRHYDDTASAKCDGCAGRSGTDRLTFEAKHDGTATLVLKYAPLRSKSDPPERELSIQVTISK